MNYSVNHPEDSEAWETMSAIKQDILRKWDSFPFPVKICCIKFVQRVVQVQSHGLISDPRVCTIPADILEYTELFSGRSKMKLPLRLSLEIMRFWRYRISKLKLRVCSTGSCPSFRRTRGRLLRMISRPLLTTASDALLVNATLNCLPGLVRSRQSIANKIINAIINFNPAQQAQGPITPATRVKVKSMERTARALVLNIMKKYGTRCPTSSDANIARNPNHPLTGKMQQHVERLMQSRLDIVDEEGSRKRGLPSEPTDGLDNAKRARLDAETPPLIKVPPLPPGRISFAQLFTLTEDTGLSSFDVKQLPPDLVVKIAVPILAHIDQSAFSQAVDAIRIRYQAYSKQQAAQPQPHEEDDDYEPEYQPMDALDNATEEADAVAAETADLQPDLVSLGPFVLPQPPPLTQDEAGEVGRNAVSRVFDMLEFTEATPKQSKGKSQQQLGFARLAGSTFDRDAWVTLLTRLATRAPAGLGIDTQADENAPRSKKKPTISDSIRETLYRYILEDFRSRLNVGITWLNEEWYNDRVQMKFAASSGPESEPAHYERWCLQLLDGMLPYLDSRDTKLFIRFLSEIPEITSPITKRVASLAKDPERVNLCVQSLL